MPTPSPTIIQLLAVFGQATTAPTLARMCTLVVGAILAPGRRTVTSALQAVGLGQAQDFSNYHEVFNRARWSLLAMSRLLLGLILSAFLSPDAPVMLLVDDTLERRRGRKIACKSLFRDAVLSTAEHVSLSWGIRWVCLCVLVPTPWTRRPWALPFCLAPVLSQKRAQQLGKHFIGSSECVRILLEKVRRWYPERSFLLVGDNGYATHGLVQDCQDTHQGKRWPVTLVSRFRLNAVLYDLPGSQPASKRGPKAKKGARQPSFTQRLEDLATVWTTVRLPWYQNETIEIEYVSAISLWCPHGSRPVPVRWMLLRPKDPRDQRLAPSALFCSQVNATPEQIMAWYLLRWNIEVTFEEMRACLGLETQRHWSAKAIGRVTPCLFALFSLVVLLAKQLHPEQLPVEKSRWYDKPEPTFRDALAAVRMHLWSHLGGVPNYGNCTSQAAMYLIPAAVWRAVQRALCYAG